MKKSFIKAVTCIVSFMCLLTSLSFAATKKANKNISLLYLFRKDYGERAAYSVYKGEELLVDLDGLKNRWILEIHFDTEKDNTILFAEKADGLYRVLSLDFAKKQEELLFAFEQKNYDFKSFTKKSLFFGERCEKSNILYEYDSRTGTIKKLYEVEDVYNEKTERYESGFIGNVQADDKNIYFYLHGGFVMDSGSFVIDRSSGEVRKSKINIGWAKPNRYKNKIIREGAIVKQSKNMMSYSHNGKSCVITDLDTFEEVQCTFKKRYTRMAGPLVLLSDDYFLVPLCITPFRDSIRNGLFYSNWTVCYSVFDIKKNKVVFKGLKTETRIMTLIDAKLL